MVNLKLVPNGIGFQTIKYFEFMVEISDIWSIFMGKFKPNRV